MIDPTQQQDIEALDAGLAAEQDPQREQRRQFVRQWFERIDEARKFDEEARKQYARDRRYARGDTGFLVDSNIIGTFIEILQAFLYARDPDVDVLPSPSAEPPDVQALWDAAQASAAPLAAAAPPEMVEVLGAEIANKWYAELRKRFAKRQRENKMFAETLEIVVSRLWQDAKLKRQAKRWVRSCLTVGVGWMKAAWQNRTARDPVMQKQINDLQDNLARLDAMRREIIDEAACADIDAKRVEYQQALEGAQAQVERIIARGFVVDMIPAEDVQVAIEVASIGEYVEAPWISHRSFMRREQAMALFGLSKEQIGKATSYSQRKPVTAQSVSPAVADDVTAEEADYYRPEGGRHGSGGKAIGECVRVEEVWCKDDNRVYTLIEGLDDFAKEPWSPVATSRFYPFFLFATSELDGQRHPQSLIARSWRLADEYARVRTAYAEHRRRTKPKTAFNAALLPEAEAKKLYGAVEQEMVPIRMPSADVPIGNVIQPIQYAALDPGLYETASIMAELERIWGVQEALSQSIATPKTATEAEIQQTGFHARTGAMRDALEDALSELAQYTAEVALANMSRDDAVHIAGPDAFWPEGVTADDLPRLVTVEIRAGSSGKPNTSAEREAWAAIMPLIQEAIQMIGQLRGTPPADMADKFEMLLRETAQRAGERMDIDAMIPQVGMGGPQPPMLPGQPSPMPGQPPGAAPMPPAQEPVGIPPNIDPLAAVN